MLKQERERIAEQVAGMESDVDALKANVNNLNEQIAKFDDLKGALEKIAGESEDISHLLESVNSTFGETRKAILLSKQAALWQSYYSCLFNQETGLNEDAFEELTDILSKHELEHLRELGDFNQLAGDDGIIDVEEFGEIIEKMLAGMEEELLSGDEHHHH